MTDLTTTYMGMHLSSPFIAASSGLTNSLDHLKELETFGARAVILKSLFEEEIIVELDRRMNEMHSENYLYPETMEFYEKADVEDTLTSYLRLIYEAKKNLEIPVIASINCVTPHNWPYFTKYLQEAGADALELNIFTLPTDIATPGKKYEDNLIDICNAVRQQASIPVSIKISQYYSSLAYTMNEAAKTGIKGITLFNRFYSPDFDTYSLEIIPASIYSNADDYLQTLRWIAIMSEKTACDMSASTGVHNGLSAAKMILAGASAVQVASVLYKNGISHLRQMRKELSDWMEDKGYETIEQYKGKLSYFNANDPAGLLRAQFMRHFAGK